MEALVELKKRLSRLAVDATPEALSAYSYDASKSVCLPAVVVRAVTAEDVVSVVNVARTRNMPVVTRGAGSGLTGGAVPSKGSILLSLEKMNQILHIDAENRTCVVEPGVVNSALQARLRKYGLFFPCDPGSAAFSTLGGNAAENACGMRGRFYGSCISHVRGLEYVNAEGEIISTGAFNNGRNLLLQNLVIGSEGMLGIVTKLSLALEKIPDSFSTSFLYYRDEKEAFAFTHSLLRKGLLPYALEYADSLTFPLIVPASSPYFRADVRALILLETPAGDLEFSKSLAESGASEILTAKDDAERAAFWAIRNNISPALYNAAPSKINEDVGIPNASIESFAVFLGELSAGSKRVKVFTFGHLCAGCFHVNFLFNEKSAEETKEAEALLERLFRKVIDLQGTLSSEHGIGLTKSRYISMELRQPALGFHKAVKAALDPDHLLNPGKVFGTVEAS